MRLDLSILLSEGYGRVVDMKYDNPGTPEDPRSAKPTVLQLGRWRHPRTKNMLVGGINLGYLNDFQKLVLRRYLPDILASKNLKGRYWAGRQDVPNRLNELNKEESATALEEIFERYYRTYNRDYINVITTKTFRFMSPSELKALGNVEDADEAQALKDKASEIATIRKEIEAIRDAGGDASDLEKKLRIALGELPAKSRKKLEKLVPPEPPESPAPVSPRMGLEPKAPEAEPEDVEARAQDAVDSKVARNNIAQIDPNIKKELKPVEPTKTNVEPEDYPVVKSTKVNVEPEEEEDGENYPVVKPTKEEGEETEYEEEDEE